MDDFVIAGAQAIKFVLESACATKDFDFVLDLRGENVSVGKKLRGLGYEVAEGSRNFQFEKPIPNSNEKMRIEFMAPEELKRNKDFRVDIDEEAQAMPDPTDLTPRPWRRQLEHPEIAWRLAE